MNRQLRTIVRTVLLLTSASSAGAQGSTPVDFAKKTDVTIPAGDVTLAATLYMPTDATGKVPAVVLGSGVAVLAFDKRGTGASTGTFEPFDVSKSPIQFQQQASDVVYAVRWLAQQPGIDTTRIGLMGGSQAGWTMPLAAAKEPLVRSIVAGCGVPLPSGVEAVHERHLNSLRPWSGSRPSVRQVHEADAHVLPFADHNFINVFTNERYSVSDVARAWLRQKRLVE